MRSRLPAPLRAYLDSWFASGAAPPPGLRVQFVPCAAVTGHCLLPAVPAALCRGQRRVPGLLAAFCAPDAPTGAWTLLLGDDVAEEVGVEEFSALSGAPAPALPEGELIALP